MSLLNRLFKKQSSMSKDACAPKEKGMSPEDFIENMKQFTMDFDEFRETVFRLVWYEDGVGLRHLCKEQVVVTPIFIEKAIEEIKPGNKWNDVLWLMAQRLITEGDWPHYHPLLEEKRCLVPNPEGGKKVMEPFVVVSNSPVDDRNARFPAVILRLLHRDMTGINQEDDTTIDRMFADWVVLGPGFYRKYLFGLDFPYGDRAMMRFPMGSPPRVEVFEGRVLRGKARLVPLLFDKFEAILAQYRSGNIRKATEDERNLFHSLIDFEIAGHPVYVVETQESRLLIYLQEENRIHWIESLDIWRSENRRKPLGSIDCSALGVLRKNFK